MYYTLLKFWSMVAGTSEAGLRSLSAVAGVVTVYLVFVIGRLALEDGKGTWIALCGAAIIALHPIQIHFSQEARAYALQTLGVAMSSVASCWWLGESGSACRPPGSCSWPRAENRNAVALFMGGATLALWMHHTGVVLVGCVFWHSVPSSISRHLPNAGVPPSILGCSDRQSSLCGFLADSSFSRRSVRSRMPGTSVHLRSTTWGSASTISSDRV